MRHSMEESRLTCRGEIDGATAASLQTAIDVVMATHPPVLLVDWRAVSSVALAGVDVLLEAANECRSKGSVVRLIPGDVGRRVLDIVGWDDIEEVRDPYAVSAEVEEALVDALSMN